MPIFRFVRKFSDGVQHKRDIETNDHEVIQRPDKSAIIALHTQNGMVSLTLSRKQGESHFPLCEVVDVATGAIRYSYQAQDMTEQEEADAKAEAEAAAKAKNEDADAVHRMRERANGVDGTEDRADPETEERSQ